MTPLLLPGRLATCATLPPLGLPRASGHPSPESPWEQSRRILRETTTPRLTYHVLLARLLVELDCAWNNLIDDGTRRALAVVSLSHQQFAQ